MSKARLDRYGFIYWYTDHRTRLHYARVLPGETKGAALCRVLSNHAEIKKLEDAGYTPADFEAQEA